MIVEIAHEVEGILVQHFLLVIALGHQIIEFFPEVMEEHRVLVDVLEEVLFRRLPVLVELDPSLFVIEVQHCVQRMIVERCFRRLQGAFECRDVQNRSIPFLTLATSSSVPSSSNR